MVSCTYWVLKQQTLVRKERTAQFRLVVVRQSGRLMAVSESSVISMLVTVRFERNMFRFFSLVRFRRKVVRLNSLVIRFIGTNRVTQIRIYRETTFCEVMTFLTVVETRFGYCIQDMLWEFILGSVQFVREVYFVALRGVIRQGMERTVSVGGVALFSLVFLSEGCFGSFGRKIFAFNVIFIESEWVQELVLIVGFFVVGFGTN